MNSKKFTYRKLKGGALTPKPVGGPPKPVGGPPKPVGGPPKPVGGPPKPVGGPPKPVGGPTKPVGSASNSNKGLLDKMNDFKENAEDKISKTFNKSRNLADEFIDDNDSMIKKGGNIMDNITEGKYNKWGFIFVIVISIILIIHFFSYIVSHYYKKMEKSPLLIPFTKNGKHTVVISQDSESINYIPIKRSENEDGIEFAYSFWCLVMDYDYKKGEWKHLFHKGNSTSYPNRAPGVWLHPNNNSMRIYMNTFNNILEYTDVEDIPIKKWFCTTIVLQNSKSHSKETKDIDISDSTTHILDVYINGNLKKSKLLTGIPRQNHGDLWVNLYGGFSGYLSRLQYHSYAPDFDEIESYLQDGPSEMTAEDTGEMPPYLDDKWWFK